MLIKLILLALLVINIDGSLSYRLGYVFANYVSYKSRYRIKYFSGRALYYSNTTASYSTSSVIRDMSGDAEKILALMNVEVMAKRHAILHGKEQPVKCLQMRSTNPFDIGLIRFPNARQLSNEQKYDIIYDVGSLNHRTVSRQFLRVKITGLLGTNG